MLHIPYFTQGTQDIYPHLLDTATTFWHMHYELSLKEYFHSISVRIETVENLQ